MVLMVVICLPGEGYSESGSRRPRQETRDLHDPVDRREEGVSRYRSSSPKKKVRRFKNPGNLLIDENFMVKNHRVTNEKRN